MNIKNVNSSVSNSKVVIFKKNTKYGNQFSIYYRIGDEFGSDSLDTMNSICDTIIYREHCKSILGRYPKNDLSISFKVPGRIHVVSFADTPYDATKRTAELIANLLKVDYTFARANPTIVNT